MSKSDMRKIIFIFCFLFAFAGTESTKGTSLTSAPIKSKLTRAEGYCNRCKNTGIIYITSPCKECGGKGFFQTKCKACNGKGKIPYTEYGEVVYMPCTQCNASGYIKEKCRYCDNGKQTVGVKCPDCGGKYR